MPHEIVGMDHPNHDLDSPAFRALNPFGQIPVIDDDGVVVSESDRQFIATDDFTVADILRPMCWTLELVRRC